MSVLGKRLKEARVRAGLSQAQLGILAGLEEASASTRMNRYELGRRQPDFALMQKLAVVLHTPVPYFFTTDDRTAQLLLAFAQLNVADKTKVLKLAQDLAG